jgi:hypothetical protein
MISFLSNDLFNYSLFFRKTMGEIDFCQIRKNVAKSAFDMYEFNYVARSNI